MAIISPTSPAGKILNKINVGISKLTGRDKVDIKISTEPTPAGQTKTTSGIIVSTPGTPSRPGFGGSREPSQPTEREIEESRSIADPIQRNLPVVRQSFAPRQSFFGRARDRILKGDSIGELRQKELDRIRQSESDLYLSGRQSQIESQFKGFENYGQQQFDFFQGQVDVGALSVDQAQGGFKESLSARRQEIVSGLLKSQDIGGMSTPEGEQFFIIPPVYKQETFLQKINADLKFGGKLFSEKPGTFFPALASSVALSSRELIATTSGVGESIKEFGFGKPFEGRYIFGAFREGTERARKGYGIQGRQEDVFGFGVTVAPFIPELFVSGIRGVKGTGSAIKLFREEGFAGTFARAGEKGSEFALRVSPIQPIPARLPSFSAETFSTFKQFEREGVIFRNIKGKFRGSDVSFETLQVVFKGDTSSSGLSLTQTKMPRFKSNLGEIFGGDRQSFSFGIQSSSNKKIFADFETGLDIFRSSKTIATRGFQFPIADITFGKGGKVSKIKPYKFGQEVYYDVYVGHSKSTPSDLGEYVFGFSGRKGEGRLVKVKDLFFGNILKPRLDETGVKILRPANIKKTPFSKTFLEVKQDVKPNLIFELPKSPKQQLLDIKPTQIQESLQQQNFALPKPQKMESQRLLQRETSGFKTGFKIGFKTIIGTSLSQNIFSATAPKVSTSPRVSFKQFQFSRITPRQLSRQFEIPVFQEPLIPISPLIPNFPFPRGGFFPLIPFFGLGGDLGSKGRRSKGRGFVRTPSFGAVLKFELTGFGGGQRSKFAEESGLVERGFGRKIPKIKLANIL